MCGADYEGNLSRTDADFLYRDDTGAFSHEASTARAEKMQNAGVFKLCMIIFSENVNW